MRCTMKKGVLKLSLAGLLAANLLLTGGMFIPVEGVAFATETQKVQTETQQVKGKITNISQKAKTIALSKSDNTFFLLKFDDDTILKGAESSGDFEVDEAILVNYVEKGGENIATSLEKVMIQLPKGVTEIKTDELAQLVESTKEIVIIDARPSIKYSEGHIRSAVSIPFSTLITMGDSGSELLDKYKDKQLVFYCGGPT